MRNHVMNLMKAKFVKALLSKIEVKFQLKISKNNHKFFLFLIYGFQVKLIIYRVLQRFTKYVF